MANILIVDDSPSMLRSVSRTLTAAGHSVTSAEDGVQALRIAQGTCFALVITDVNMPNMDGITLVGKLRQLPAFAKTPILMLTTVMKDSQKQRARSAGANGWLVKPFEPEKLLAIVKKVA